MLRARLGLLISSLVTLASFASAVQEACPSTSMYDVDVFHYFTQQARHGNLSHLDGAHLVSGTHLNLPAFEINGTGVTLSDKDVSDTIRSVSRSSHELTLYGSVLFVTNEPGGTLLSLTYSFDEDTAYPFMGLHINRSTNEIVIFYQTTTHMRLEPFQYTLQKGRWTKLSATLTGNLLVLHADCKEVARRKIPIPNYYFGEDRINVNVGKGMRSTELSSNGYSGSAQGVGVWLGRNGLRKQCPDTPDAAQCAMCGHHVKAMQHLNILRQQVEDLQSKVSVMERMSGECAAVTEAPQHTSSCFKTNCLIDDVTVEDDEYVMDRSGRICYCRNGVAKCVDQSTIGNLPPIATPPSVSQTEKTSSGKTCPYGSDTIPDGMTVYNVVVINGMTRQCVADTCNTYPLPKVTTVTEDCAKYVNADCSALSEDEVVFAQCCGDCDACDVAACPEGMKCISVGNMDTECVCPDGQEIRLNGSSVTCIDRDECSLGTQQGGHNCPINSDCINTDGSFICDCHDGYLLDDTVSIPTCNDINECLENQCPDHAVCTNTIASFQCSCLEGYQEEDGACLPICDMPCENGGTCSSPNSCSCVPGFTGENCEMDIDECMADSNLCHGNVIKCINNHGGYFCQCKEGYRYNAKKGECDDVLECDMHGCAENAQCIEVFGSFKCRCLSSLGDCSGDCNNTISSGVIKHGHSIVSVKSQCDNCTCKDGKQMCAPLECNCGDPDVSYECCPHCNDTSICVLGSVLLSPGAKYVNPNDRCQVYECQMAGGKAVVQEITVQCPALGDCPSSYIPEGACCPACKSSQCIGRECNQSTSLECESVSCPTLSCAPEEVLTMPESCCPICEAQLVEETVYCSMS